MECSSSIFDLNNDDKEEEEEDEQLDFASSSEVDLLQTQNKIESNINLKCRVCGAPAHGYNFDQISCESCKAFFRRNAFRNLSDLKCRFTGSCQITIESRRLCTYCRLKKCFNIKMRKEWIRTDEERHLRKLKRLNKQEIKINQFYNNRRNNDDLHLLKNSFIQSKQQSIYKMNNSSPNLTLDDWSLINKLSKTYDIWALANETNYVNNYSLVDSSLTKFLNDEQNVYRNLIQFFKQIQQFKQLDIEDQILLIKCNITHLVHIHHVLKDNFQENPQIGLHMSKWINQEFHRQMSKNRHSLDYFIQHPIVLKLALVTMIFVINLSRLPYKQLAFEFIDKNLLIKNQNFFVTLLWKYLNVIYNEKDAIQAMQLIVFQYLRYQLLMEEMEIIIIQQNNPEQFHPLTKSVLRLT